VHLQSLSIGDCRFYDADGSDAGMHTALANLGTTLQQLTSVRLSYSESSLRDNDGAGKAFAALPMTHVKVWCCENQSSIDHQTAAAMLQLTVKFSDSCYTTPVHILYRRM
jgi:hypothetical protein